MARLTVEELIDDLRQMPLTAYVMVWLPVHGSELVVDLVTYDQGVAVIELEYDPKADEHGDFPVPFGSRTPLRLVPKGARIESESA